MFLKATPNAVPTPVPMANQGPIPRFFTTGEDSATRPAGGARPRFGPCRSSPPRSLDRLLQDAPELAGDDLLLDLQPSLRGAAGRPLEDHSSVESEAGQRRRVHRRVGGRLDDLVADRTAEQPAILGPDPGDAADHDPVDVERTDERRERTGQGQVDGAIERQLSQLGRG